MIDFCPELEVLVSIGRGGDGGTCEPALAAHIENCPLCREFIERYAQRGVDSLHPILITSLPMDDMMPRIDGFTIERELGRGSTGVVYLARRDALSRLVALKLWPGGRRASESERSKWQREAEAVASVSHPNVVTLYEACVTDDWFLLVLEFVPGGTLKDRLTQPLGARDAARLVECVARAIHRIHELGILHLDLKPSNILLDGKADAPLDRMVPKVSDFSVARTRAATTTDTAGMVGGGTPSYMAPEQLMSERSKLTAAADIHGLGAILYHMLTGRPPYQGATLVETIDQLRHLDVVPPRRLNPGIPRDLETICLKCLERDPGRRYATAEALADELGRWLDGRAILTRRVSVVEKSLRLCRRRPVISVLSGALVAKSGSQLSGGAGPGRRIP
jgi:serine/threonine protein kinase